MNQEQIDLLNKLGLDENSPEDIVEEKVGEYLTLRCLDKYYKPNREGIICESILDYISDKD